MVRTALQSHPSHQLPSSDGDFATLLARLSEAEKAIKPNR
jgi:hypothetical protein